MTEEESSKFTTKRRSIGSGGELKWGGEDGEEWSEAVESSEGITVQDDGTISTGSEIPDSVVFLPQEDTLDKFGGAISDYVIDSSEPKFNTEHTDLSLKGDSDRPEYIGSLSGLNRYPKIGETHRVAMFLEDSDSWPMLHFGCDSESGESNSYSVNLRRPNDDDRLEIDRYDNGDRVGGGAIADIYNVGLNAGEWHEVEILHEANGDMTVTLFDNSGSEMGTINHNDNNHITDGEYDGNGIGFRASGDSSIGVAWDYWRIIA